MEKTLIIIKPDAVKRDLIGEIISRISRKGYKITHMKMTTLTKEVITEHYIHHSQKPFFPEIVAYMTSGPVVCMCVEGAKAVLGMRNLVGATDPFEALPGTIRGDFAFSKSENLVHASDSVENAEIEFKRFFG
jgi:nucleoside-diphosphate kinase